MQVTKLWRVVSDEHTKERALSDWQGVEKNVEFWTDEKEAIASWYGKVKPYLEEDRRVGMSYTQYEFTIVLDKGLRRVQIFVDEWTIESFDI